MGNYRYVHPEKKQVYITSLLNGAKPSVLSQQTGYSTRSLSRLRKLYLSTGTVTRRVLPRGAPRLLTSGEVDYLEGLVLRTPDIYLHELRRELWDVFDVEVTLSTITCALKQRGFSRKKVTRLARERSEEARAAYLARIAGEYKPEQLVFVDESSCNRHTCNRTYAWAPSGARARRRDYFVRGKRYSILPAISLDGVIHLDIIQRSWDGAQFRSFMEGLLSIMQPFPLPNSVVIMDNASVHHFDGLRELIEAHGCRLQYLPAYSPDFNPIEEGFSAMKNWIRDHRDEVMAEMEGEEDSDPMPLLWEAVLESMTPLSIAGWFADSGYISHVQ